MGGWIKLHRSILQWEWYDDINTWRLFLHLLLTVNHEDKKWHGEDVKAGSIVTSYSKLAGQARMSVKQVRLSLDKLKQTGEVATKTTNKYSVITLVKWGDYQGSSNEEGKPKGKPQGKQRANKGQTKGKQGATTKEVKERKNDKNERNIKHKYGQYKKVLLTDEQLNKLKTEFPTNWKEWIDKVDSYCESTGKSYKNYLATIRTWAKKDKPKKTGEIPEDDYFSVNSSWDEV